MIQLDVVTHGPPSGSTTGLYISISSPVFAFGVSRSKDEPDLQIRRYKCAAICCTCRHKYTALAVMMRGLGGSEARKTQGGELTLESAKVCP